MNKEYIKIDIGFIDNMMPYAPSVYTVIYLCALRLGEGCGINEISKKLNMSENDVFTALMYFKDRNLLDISDGIISFGGKSEKESCKQEKKIAKTVFCQNPPQYEPEELVMYADKNADVKALFDMAQGKIGRMLTYSDMSVVFMMYHWLGLKKDVIELLLDFCVERGHRNMRYIEKVAIDWCENEINTVEDAKRRIFVFNNVYRRILNAMGQGMREPVEKEIKYMKKWHEEYQMPMELIELACTKAVMKTGSAQFSYANKIIETWHKKGFKTIEEVEQSEKAFAEGKKQQAKDEAQSVPKKNNRFINHEQRTYDYAQLERLERERLRAEVKK